MRVVLQRVSRAEVGVDGEVVGSVGVGWLALLGVAKGDRDQEAVQLAARVVKLRGFPDESGRMNRDVSEAGGGVLAVSQFTLVADCRKGRRPSFAGAAEPAEAERLYQLFIQAIADAGVPTSTGRFGTHMAVELLNDGPVTFVIETRESEGMA